MPKAGTFALWVLGLLATQAASANVVGSGAQNFNTISSGLDFVTVQSSQTLLPGVINLGLFVNDAINSLPYFESSTQSRINFSNHLIGSDLNVGVGVLPRWDVGLSFASVLEQSVSSDQSFHGQFASTGLTEVRAGTKARVWGDDRHGIALIGSLNSNLIANNPYAGIGGGPTLNLEAAGDLTYRQVRIALNLGHRWFHPGSPVPNSPIQPQKNQIIASAAASYLLPFTDTKLIAELFGGRPVSNTDSTTDRANSSLEFLAGAKHDFSTHFAFHAGMGTKVIDGASSPDWRIYTGLNFTFGPVFAKNEAPFSSVREEGGFRLITQNISFEFNSDELTDESQRLMEAIATYLRSEEPIEKISVEGHTDSIGNAAYYVDLSQRRANAIRNYMIKTFHFAPEKIDAVGFGAAKPIADNGNFQGRQANRRVEFRMKK